jgi:glucans biosynthesis protein C
VLVPPMFYLARLGLHGSGEPYWRFWLRFANIQTIASGLLARNSWISGGTAFDPAHLWFLYVLLVFSVALLPLSRYLIGSRGARLAGRHPVTALAMTAIPMMVTEAVFGPGCQHRWLGAAGLCVPVRVRVHDRGRPAAPVGDAACSLASPGHRAAGHHRTGGLGGHPHRTGGQRRVRRGARLERAPGTGRLGVDSGDPGVRRLHRRSPALARAGRSRRGAREVVAAPARYSHEAVLPFYLLHEPVIVATALLVVRWHAPTLARYPVLVAASFAVSLALYELAIRRFRVTRFLFGMKPRARKPGRATRRYARCA